MCNLRLVTNSMIANIQWTTQSWFSYHAGTIFSQAIASEVTFKELSEAVRVAMVVVMREPFVNQINRDKSSYIETPYRRRYTLSMYSPTPPFYLLTIHGWNFFVLSYRVQCCKKPLPTLGSSVVNCAIRTQMDKHFARNKRLANVIYSTELEKKSAVSAHRKGLCRFFLTI